MTTAIASDTRPLSRFAAQLGRFGLVGVANTVVDVGCTNLLYLLWSASTPVQLAAISVIAGVIATIHSYVLNSRWTFRAEARGSGTQLRFFAFAVLGLVTQAAVTLFVAHLMLRSGGPASLTILNVAKLAAVVAAAGVTFVGYRVAVFTPRAIADFRDRYVLAPGHASLAAIGALLLLATVVRVAFLAVAPVVYGDAIHYSWDATLIANGEWSAADGFWHSAFDYWQALLVPLGLGQFGTLVLASLIPGVLLVVPGYLIALRLYGRTAALVAGAILAVHPRLVEYSVNGYAETFFLHAATWGLLGLTALVRGPRRVLAALLAGVGLALWFLVRNEAVLAVAVLLGVLGLAWWRSGGVPSKRALTALVVGAAIVVAAYVACDVQVFGAPKLFSKGSNLARAHVEMLDPREAARETYGVAAPGQAAPPPVSAQVVALRLVERWPRNLVYTLERIPGVLLSPLFLLALLLPALCRRRASVIGEEWPLLMFTVWPLVFYPLLQLEPRMLLPVVIGTAIFGAGALVATGDLISTRTGRRWTRWVPAVVVAGAFLPLLPAVAGHTLRERGFHHEVGAWIAEHVSPDTAVSGDGYGYVNASAFWAGRSAKARIWTDDAVELGRWARIGGPRVVIVYERYLREQNPELLGVLETGIPGLDRVKAFTLPDVGRVQVYATPGGPGVEPALIPSS